jgi:hypothetical protein
MANPLDALNAEAVQTSTDSGLNQAEKAAATDFYGAATAQINSGKGSKFSMPKYTGDVPVSESVLENMQRMLYEKEQGRGSLANTLQDVLAIFPGDPTLRSQSIGARNAQRLQEEADIFNLQQGISSGETAREQAKLAGKDLRAFTQGTGGGGGAGAGGMSPGMVAGVDPAVLQRVDQLSSQGKYKQAEKLLETALIDINKAKGTAKLGKEFYMPDIQVQDPNNPGRTKYVSVADIQSGGFQPTAQGQATMQNKVPTGGAPTGGDAEAAKAAGVPVISAFRPYEKQKQLYDAYVAGGKQGNPVAPPGMSMHQSGLALDVDMKKADEKALQWLRNNGYQQTLGAKDPNHWERRSADVSVFKPTSANAPSAAVKPSTGLTSEQKGFGQASEAADKEFRENSLKPLAERVNTQRNDKLYADMAIDALKTGNFGPGSSIGQLTKEAAQMLGVPLSPKEREEYFNKLTIEQVKQNFVASSARAAMGAQFTQVESERFAKTLAGINEPKEYIKTVYQIKKALAEIDEAKLKYIRSSKQGLNEAEASWAASGEDSKIMRRTVDKFRDIPTGGGSSAPASSGGATKNLVVDFNTLLEQQKNKKPGN